MPIECCTDECGRHRHIVSYTSSCTASQTVLVCTSVIRVTISWWNPEPRRPTAQFDHRHRINVAAYLSLDLLIRTSFRATSAQAILDVEVAVERTSVLATAKRAVERRKIERARVGA